MSEVVIFFFGGVDMLIRGDGLWRFGRELLLLLKLLVGREGKFFIDGELFFLEFVFLIKVIDLGVLVSCLFKKFL